MRWREGFQEDQAMPQVGPTHPGIFIWQGGRIEVKKLKSNTCQSDLPPTSVFIWQGGRIEVKKLKINTCQSDLPPTSL